MSMNPKVSILVPVYGVEKFIERCAVSLFEQTFEDIEFIFVNDCTPDNSIDILRKTLERYPNRKNQVLIINHDINSGVAVARNTLIDNATGDYILFVDSDDFLELDAVEKLIGKAIVDNSDIVVCDTMIEWGNDLLQRSNQKIGISKVNFVQLLLSTKTMIGLPNKLLKREIFVKNNIRTFKDINFGEDYMIISKFAYYANTISKVDEALYYYSQTNPNSYTTQKLSKKNIDSIVFVLNNLTDFFKTKQDYHLYEEVLLQGKLKKKMETLFFADKECMKEISILFPETDDLEDKTFLLSRDKISYPLLKRNYIGLFLIYRNIYKILFNIKNNLVKR